VRKSTIDLDGTPLPLFSLNTLVIGSGAAALNAALRLVELGQSDVAIATERWGGGTSNNAGSDKQTYYKVSCCGERPDSPLEMAKDLFGGGCMHGDIALCEAYGSLPAFFRLVDMGVPFPRDRYGAYPGYTTDHDPRARATSAGPLTSHLMFEALAGKVQSRGIEVFDRHQIVALLTTTDTDPTKGQATGATGSGTRERRVIGALALDTTRLDTARSGFVLFNAQNVILGTGGPGGLYADSVYPTSQLGAMGMAFEAGAMGHNLTESQFGLASLAPRWNLSGSYQQVIPRYVSTDSRGGDEREFLNAFFPRSKALASAVFLKGYQWPFDPRKIEGHGSSLIDLLVYRERRIESRRVYLDFTRNPSSYGPSSVRSSAAGRDGGSFVERITGEAREYLERSDALAPTPIERLERMNPPAVELFRRHGVDLGKDRLEISVCAQHNNGGLVGGVWWESNLRHLFPVGEVNGTHGVYRPGGTALNAGQVGGQRAAQYIAKHNRGEPLDEQGFLVRAAPLIRRKLALADAMNDPTLAAGADSAGAVAAVARMREGRSPDPACSARQELQDRMSRFGAHVRDPRAIKPAIAAAWKLLKDLQTAPVAASVRDLPRRFRDLDLCLPHAVYLEAIGAYLNSGGGSRGSYLVLDSQGATPCDGLEAGWEYRLEAARSEMDSKILEIWLDEKQEVHTRWTPIRPIPAQDLWFERVWQDFREDRIVQ